MGQGQANHEDFALMRRLRDRGIPMDEYELEGIEVACRGLEICEDIDFPSTAFNLSSGGSGYELNVLIANDSERPLAPVHIGFEGPEWVNRMRLLPDPHKQYAARRGNTLRQVRDESGSSVDYSIARNTYVFPTRPRILQEREIVLNHRVSRSCILYPGDSVEGLLLAVGEEPIPLDYRDREHIKVRLTVFDQHGRFHRALFHPMVERSRQEERRWAEIGSQDQTRIRDKRAATAARLDDLKPLGKEKQVDVDSVLAAASRRSSSGR